jgi:flagellar biosynthetic protein FliR
MFGFALVLFRTLGLFTAAPILGARMVPTRARLALSLVAALAAFTGAGMPTVPPPAQFLALALAVSAETVMGLLAGLAARFVLDAAQAAGQTAGLSMGLGFGALIDPASGAESTEMGQLMGLIALGAAVATGLHREAISWLAASVHTFPPGGDLGLSALLAHGVAQSMTAIGLAVRITYPLLAAVTLGHLTLGAISRAAPTFNLSSVGFSVAILAGGAAIFLVTPPAAQLCAQAALNAFPTR